MDCFDELHCAEILADGSAKSNPVMSALLRRLCERIRRAESAAGPTGFHVSDREAGLLHSLLGSAGFWPPMRRDDDPGYGRFRGAVAKWARNVHSWRTAGGTPADGRFPLAYRAPTEDEAADLLDRLGESLRSRPGPPGAFLEILLAWLAEPREVPR